MGFDLRDFRGEPLEWLLDLQVGEDVLRFAQRPLEAPTGVQGALARYEPGLDFPGEVPDAADPFQEAPSARKVDLSLYLPASLKLPELVERGFDFSAARGRLWLWSPSTDALELVVNGVVRGVEYGLPEDPLTCSLEEVEEDDSALFPPADARIDAGSWPNAAEGVVGEWYPWVIGTPGNGTNYVTPGFLADTTTDVLLVAAHPVEATTVDVINDDDGTFATIAVAQQRDGRGRLVSVVDLTASGVTIDPEASYFVSWPNGGGLQREDGGLLAGAGDVLWWMLSFSRLRVDRGRLAAAVPFLNSFRIDTAVVTDPDSRFPPWDWIVDHLLPILPVAMRSSAEGFYPVVWRFDATADMAVTHLEVPLAGEPSPRASLRTSVSYSRREDVANELVLSYGHDPRLDLYTGRKILSGDPARSDSDDDAKLNLYCILSRTRYRDPDGQPEVLVLEESSEAIWSDSTAAAVLAWWAQRYALQARLVGYTADLELVGHLEPGDVLTVTHPDLSWTRKVFLVEEVVRSVVGWLDIDLRAVEDAAQAMKGTA